MEKIIKISALNSESKAFESDLWEENSHAIIKYEKGSKAVIIEANKGGFISLARIFLSMAENELPGDFVVHLDAVRKKNGCGDLQKNSNDVAIYKV